MTEKVFLLGGYDLEMQEIKNILEQNGNTYLDKQLKWDNALLEAYRDELEIYLNNKAYAIYGIELQEQGFDLPSNYYRIDHHNALSDLPSSIEQVCTLLDVPMSRHLELVAANDKAYIPGMEAIGASIDEISDIRLKDRQAQGVTQRDEELAKQALRHKKREGDLIIIYSHSDRFSPICDSLYPSDKLLIYTDDELVYYGKGKDKLVTLFSQEIKNGNIYHGGGDTGYIGTGKGKYGKSYMETIKEMIIKEIAIK